MVVMEPVQSHEVMLGEKIFSKLNKANRKNANIVAVFSRRVKVFI